MKNGGAYLVCSPYHPPYSPSHVEILISTRQGGGKTTCMSALCPPGHCWVLVAHPRRHSLPLLLYAVRVLAVLLHIAMWSGRNVGVGMVLRWLMCGYVEMRDATCCVFVYSNQNINKYCKLYKATPFTIFSSLP